jgi:uncharacterized DUF497 family protein
VRVEWDVRKAESNWRKHGVRFENAAQVFRDPLHETVDDPFAVGEARMITVGAVRGYGLLVVVHTLEGEGTLDEIVRLISARRPEPHERRKYENG